MTVKNIVLSWKWRILEAGYTYKGFAEVIGITPQSLSAYINGKQTPSYRNYELIEDLLEGKGV